jgi:hypothetical protein
MTAETDALLRAILGELKTQTALLEMLAPPVATTTRIDGVLAGAIAAAMKARAFTAGEVCKFAAADATLSAALEAARADTPQRLGKALQRLQGREIGGVRIARIGVDGCGAVWCAARSGAVDNRGSRGSDSL